MAHPDFMVEDANIDGVYVWENSTASVVRSDVGTARTAWTGSGKTAINITDSTVGSVETFALSEQAAGTTVIRISNSTVEYAVYIHLNSTAWIEDSSVAEVDATGNATVWLIRSSVRQVSIKDNARVLLGWNLPLFGLVGVPYQLIPMIQATSIIAVVIGLAAVFYAIWRKRRRANTAMTIAYAKS